MSLASSLSSASSPDPLQLSDPARHHHQPKRVECEIRNTRLTNRIILQHTQRSVRARAAKGVVETCGGHGDEADCYCAGFRWGFG